MSQTSWNPFSINWRNKPEEKKDEREKKDGKEMKDGKEKRAEVDKNKRRTNNPQPDIKFSHTAKTQSLLKQKLTNCISSESESEDEDEYNSLEQSILLTEETVNKCFRECESIRNSINKPEICGKTKYHSYKQKLYKILNTLDAIEVSNVPTLRPKIKETVKFVKSTEQLLESVYQNKGTKGGEEWATRDSHGLMEVADEGIVEQEDIQEIPLDELLTQDPELNLLKSKFVQCQSNVQNLGSKCIPIIVETSLLNNISINNQERTTGAHAESLLSKPIQILIELGNDQFKLNDEALHQILYREDVRHRKIVPVCVVGRFRRGKSFLLNFMLRYLSSQGASDWLTKEPSSVQGFEWRGGSVRETSGIVMWHEPFLVGDDLAVLLFDTQGTFDGETSIRVNTFIFALATMLSATQIYNLSEFIQMDDFTNLQTFLEYGRMVMAECDETAFQNLALLVRDWKFPHEKPYGLAGGKLLLSEWMKKTEGSAAREVTEMLSSCFDSIWCYLMPYPGDNVSKDPNFTGNIKDIDPEFIKYLSTFIEKTLDIRKLVPKRNGRSEMRAQDFLQYARMCVEELQKTDLTAQSILENAAAVEHTKYVTLSLGCYETEMNNHIKVTKDIDGLHHSCQQMALSMYDSAKKFGAKNVTMKYRDVLIKEIQDIYEKEVKRIKEALNLERQEMLQEKIRAAKRLHKKKIKEFIDQESLEKCNFSEYQIMLRKETIKYFVQETKNKISDAELVENIGKLDKRLKEIYDSNLDEYNKKRTAIILRKREEDCKNLVTRAQQQYHQTMMAQTEGDKICEDIEYNHQHAKNQAMECIEALYVKYKGKHSVQKYATYLDDTIEKEFEKFCSANDAKLREKEHADNVELQGLKVRAEAYYTQKIKSHGEEIFNDKVKLKKAHKNALDCLEKEIFKPITAKFSSLKCNAHIKKSKEIIKNLHNSYKDLCHNNICYKMLIDSYERDIQQIGAQSITSDILLQHHEKMKAEICKTFEDNCSTTQNWKDKCNKLTKELDTIFERIHQHKKTTEAAQVKKEENISSQIFNFFNSRVVHLDVGKVDILDLEVKLNDILNETFVELSKHWEGSDDSLTKKWDELHKVMLKECSTLLEKNKNLKPRKSEYEIACDEGTQKYDKEMTNFLNKEPDIEALKKFHKIVLKAAQRVFSSSSKTMIFTKEMEDDFLKGLEICYEKHEIACALKQRNKRMEKAPKKGKSYAIGIDLGTTYSCATVFRNNKVELIRNKEKQHTTPSVVYIGDKDIMVGEAAQHKGFEDVENCISEVKRIIGLQYKDSVVQELKKVFGFNIINEKNLPVIKTTKNKKKIWKVEDISAEVLKELKRCAEVHLNSEVHDAVVTIPAYFTEPQRSATMQACNLAGLNVLRLLNEPTAAAITYGIENMSDQSRRVLVFDFGGGTCDISILEVKSGNFTVKASCGDNKLGGEDFDDRLMEFVIERIEAKHKNEFDTSTRRRLRFKCEIAKRRLTDSPEYTISLVECFDGEDIDFSLKRKDFEDTCSDLFERALKPVENCLKEAKMQKNQIDEIILAGGSSRIPKIQQMLSAFFDGKMLNTSVNPDEAIAQGAAIEAARLTGECQTAIQVSDITPFSLGISLVNNTISVQIPKNSPIPSKNTKTYTTTTDFQSAIQVCVYQGEHFSDKDKNTLLGDFTLNNIKQARAGITKADVTFEINANGILEVRAEEKGAASGENASSITITKNVCS